jgi:hypothetical protein
MVTGHGIFTFPAKRPASQPAMSPYANHVKVGAGTAVPASNHLSPPTPFHWLTDTLSLPPPSPTNGAASVHQPDSRAGTRPRPYQGDVTSYN